MGLFSDGFNNMTLVPDTRKNTKSKQQYKMQYDENFNILSPCGHVLQTYCILLTSAYFSIFHYSKLTCICFLSDRNLIEQHMVFPVQ